MLNDLASHSPLSKIQTCSNDNQGKLCRIESVFEFFNFITLSASLRSQKVNKKVNIIGSKTKFVCKGMLLSQIRRQRC